MCLKDQRDSRSGHGQIQRWIFVSSFPQNSCLILYNKLVKKIFPKTFSYMYIIMYAHIQFFLKGGGVKGMAVFAEGMVVQGLLYTVYIIYD